jgi:hypothetical protein
MEILVLAWPVLGVAGHIIACNKMKTWCGTPIWEEMTAYLMFIPALILGPFYFVGACMHRSR